MRNKYYIIKIMKNKYFKIAKRIVEILFWFHHLLTYMEHYDVEFNNYQHPDQHIEVVT